MRGKDGNRREGDGNRTDTLMKEEVVEAAVTAIVEAAVTVVVEAAVTIVVEVAVTIVVEVV